MTNTQENDIHPTDLIHWLYEDALILTEDCRNNRTQRRCIHTPGGRGIHPTRYTAPFLELARK